MNKHIFPSHLLDQSKKGKDWCKQYAMAAWHQFCQLGDERFYNGREKFKELREYAKGEQSVDQYKQKFSKHLKAKENKTWRNIDWSILKIAPRFVRVVMGKINNAKKITKVRAIDPLAVSLKKDYEIQLREYVLNQKLLSDITASTGIEFDQPQSDGLPMPQNSDDIEIHMQLGYKDRFAMEMMDWLNLVDEVNDNEQLRYEVIEDLITVGCGGYRVFVDSNNFIRKRRVIPENTMVAPHSFADCRDAEYMGEVMYLTIAELRQLAGNQFTEEEYQKIAEQNRGRDYHSVGQWFDGSSQRHEYDDQRIRVLDLEWHSTDTLIHEKKKTNSGKTVLNKKSLDWYKPDAEAQPGREVIRTDIKNVYRCMWVIDTDYCFNYGLATDMQRSVMNLGDTRLSYCIFDIGTSFVKEIIPNLNNIQLNWLQYQNHMMRSKPRGIAINLDKLAEVAMDGAGGEKMTPREILEMYAETGDQVYKDSTMPGQANAALPFQELDGGMSDAALQHYQFIIQQMDMIRNVTGINDIIDGTTPHQDTGKAVAEIAMGASNNALDWLHYAERKVSENCKKREAALLPEAVKRGLPPALSAIIGSNSVSFLSKASIVDHEFKVWYEEAPSDEERYRLDEKIKVMLQNGEIGGDDALMIEREDNIERAIQLLRIKRKQRMAEAQQANQQNVQDTAAAQQQSNQQTHDNKLAELEKEYELKSNLTVLEKSLEEKNLLIKLQTEMRKAQRDNEFKLQAQADQHIDTLERIDAQGEIDILRDSMKIEGQKEVAKLKPKPKPAGASKK